MKEIKRSHKKLMKESKGLEREARESDVLGMIKWVECVDR